ncbi:bifunctional UDP-sugar hydrolase/5'-nucleotidase [Candidatus Izemoplasma sp. B36]|uniref:bifunctional metallophosphatase/5'-nucleotidase n=1 Tax=Candidatus Izemoplasma sp. B36 TaxID=3242468 RepID=UPI003556CDBC
MRKIIIFVLSVLTVLSLVACGDITSANTLTTTNQETTVITDTDLPTTDAITSNTLETTEITTIEAVSTEIPTTVASTTVTTEVTTDERYQDISFYSINDFHGGTYSDVFYLEQIGAFFKYKKANDENTIILSNGDIFQGAALSNYYHGRPIVDVFNNIGFDGFIIGNHEFDWGIDEILNYKDGNLENGEMDSPILAANIVYKDTQEPLENTIPYIIKEVSGVKVGVIGLIGEVIDSISATMVENIEFLEPGLVAGNYAYELRENQDCDIVVVYIHDGSSINYELASLDGQYRIDAVFNGHTHWDQEGYIERSDESRMYYAQINPSYSMLASITLEYDTVEQKIVSGSVYNYSNSDISYYNDQTIEDILFSYSNDIEYATFVSEILTTSTGNFSKSTLATWGASVIRDYLGIDVGAVNRGGFRHEIYPGEITMGDMIENYPFDNYINTCKLTGQQLLDFYEDIQYYNDDVVFDDALTYNNGNLYINGVLVEASILYTVGAVDYIFNKTDYAFLDGQDITITTYLMRDLLVEDLRNSNGSFNPNNGTNYQEITYYYDYDYYKDLKEYLYI